jgi:hypothetical protein
MADLENPISIIDDGVNYGGSMQGQAQQGHAPVSSSPSPSLSSSKDPSARHDTAILTLAGIYTILLILLFALPPVVAKMGAGDGFDDLIRVLGVILLVGGGAVITAITTLSVAWCHWSRLSRTMRILAVYPLVCSLLILAIVYTLSKLWTDNNLDGDAYEVPTCAPGEVAGVDCPLTYAKNETNTTSGSGYPNYNLRHFMF